VTWLRSECTGGTLTTKVSSDAQLFKGTSQTLSITGTTSARTLRIAPTTVDRQVTVRLTPQSGVCRVDFAISPTRVPARYEHGSKDVRHLGLHFAPLVFSP
jgi:hypothetical protein